MRSSDCKSADLTANHSSPEQRPNRLSFGNRFSFFYIYTVFNFSGENVEKLPINSEN